MTLAAKSFPGSTVATVFADDFAYAGGDLTGQGPWLAWGATGSWTVSGDSIIPVTTGIKGDRAPVPIDPAGSWSISAIVSYDVPSDQLGTFELGLSATPLGNAVLAVLDWEDTDPGNGIVSHVSLFGSAGQIATAGPISFAPGVFSQHTVTLTSASGVARIVVDGVEVIGATAWPTTGVPASLVISTGVSVNGDNFEVRSVLVTEP